MTMDMVNVIGMVMVKVTVNPIAITATVTIMVRTTVSPGTPPPHLPLKAIAQAHSLAP